MPLSDTTIRTAKPKDKLYRLTESPRVSACAGDAIDLLRFLRQVTPAPTSTARR